MAINASRRFTMAFRGDIRRKQKAAWRPRNCDLWVRGSIAQICDALAAKTDIDWF
jgi:hypothetical protein